MGFDVNEARDEAGRWIGSGVAVAGKARAAVDWIKGGEARKAIGKVVTEDRVKTAVSLGIKSALYHLGNMDDPAMEVIDPVVHDMVHNVQAHLTVSSIRARDTLHASIGSMRAAIAEARKKVGK